MYMTDAGLLGLAEKSWPQNESPVFSHVGGMSDSAWTFFFSKAMGS